MKPIWIVVLALALTAPVASRAQVSDDTLGALKQQLQDMQQQMQKMQQKIDELEAARTNAPPAAAPAKAVTPEQLKEVDEKVDSVVEAQKKVLPSEFNPAIGLEIGRASCRE